VRLENGSAGPIARPALRKLVDVNAVLIVQDDTQSEIVTHVPPRNLSKASAIGGSTGRSLCGRRVMFRRDLANRDIFVGDYPKRLG
jgi:hypothetical protein